MAWPADAHEDLEAYYGRHELRPDGRGTPVWEREHLTSLVLPFPMTLAWDLSRTVKRVPCHVRVADSLQAVLEGILRHYETVEGVQQARMHLFGGCYNYRRVSGSSRLSAHAWGAGIDLDPDRNPLGKAYDEGEGMHALPGRAVREGRRGALKDAPPPSW